MIGWIILGVVVLVVIVLILWVVSIYNRFVSLKNASEASLGQLGQELCEVREGDP